MRSEAMLKRATLAALCLAIAGCAGMSDTEQRALTGTAAGAAGGAVVGAIAGNTAMGAAIGAGTGLVGGLVVDKVQKDKEAAYQRGVAAGRSGG
jgi:uncharacterized membrane protein